MGEPLAPLAEPSDTDRGDAPALPSWIAQIAAGTRPAAPPGERALAEHALGRLYDATFARVFTVTRRICIDSALAEEVAGDVYLQVWRDAARFDAVRGAPWAWLLVIARSRSLDALRRRDGAIVVADPTRLAEGESAGDAGEAERGVDTARDGDPLDLLAAVERSSAVHAALSAMPARERQLLALAFFRGLTHGEIAVSTGLPLGTVKTAIRRALHTLRGRLALHEPGDAVPGTPHDASHQAFDND